MTPILPLSALCVGLLLTPSLNAAPNCSKQSPAHTVALLELYTSEGCSSCPPADRFVSNLHETGLTAEQVVPLSLHVDYWDYIGWKDRFASGVFTQRQRWLAGQAGSRTVYTPEIFIAGQEQRRWRNGVAAEVQRVNARPARAQIGIALAPAQGTSLPVEVEVEVKTPETAQLFVALYENRLSSNVNAGENSGVVLRHDYVVRDWIGPVAIGAEGKADLPRALKQPDGAIARNLGVAAFVQGARGEVLQALALPLCDG